MNKYSFYRNAGANESGSPVTEDIIPAFKVGGESFIKENAPKTSTFIGTVAEVSGLIEPKSADRKPFHVIAIVSQDGTTKKFAVSSAFLKMNESKLAPDVTLCITVENTVKGSTTYTDRKSGEVIAHTESRENIQSVLLATKEQASVMSNEAILNRVRTFGAELEKFEARPAMLASMTALLQSAMK